MSYVDRNGLPADMMICPECGGKAYSDSVDVGVGLIVRGNFECECGWEIGADGKTNVAAYEDYFPDLPHGPVLTLEDLLEAMPLGSEEW